MKRVVITTPGLFGYPYQSILNLDDAEADNLLDGKHAVLVVPDKPKVVPKPFSAKPATVPVTPEAIQDPAGEAVPPEADPAA